MHTHVRSVVTKDVKKMKEEMATNDDTNNSVFCLMFFFSYSVNIYYLVSSLRSTENSLGHELTEYNN